ncbi:hypothetical protein RDWZM_000264 [Blomia tropicalis]|uniref:Transcription factor CBF/NF-Y/archaeal histone domain-containing protein n=1 Tax=Blomia tropicalis TaxID=40697 RepID=A0A9Q0MAA1_BLOTA|nr:Chromatin accessibility complex protein 1 [Blomia tropicalis]KAJ6221719.1 hypothetical protein RDWZM_000264 [Blomia tropicalis]
MNRSLLAHQTSSSLLLDHHYYPHQPQNDEPEDEGDTIDNNQSILSTTNQSSFSMETTSSSLLANTSTTSNKEKAKKRMSRVPLSRVSSIMRSSPNLTTVKNDAVALTAHAAELFVRDLVQRTYQHVDLKSELKYEDLADFIASSDINFLKDIIPKTITVAEYYELQKKRQMLDG